MAKDPAKTRSRTLITELFSYALVGLLTNFVGYCVYLFITYAGLPPKITMTVLYAVGASISFWGNRKITFRHSQRGMGVAIRYLVTYSAGYLINLTLLYVLVDRLGYAHQAVQAAAIIIVAGFLFLTLKFVVFRPLAIRPENRR